MCAIVDTNVAHQVFKDKRPEAGERFLQWINSGNLRVVVGGKLLHELNDYGKAREWLRQGLLASKVNRIDDNQVNERTEELRRSGEVRSDDPHVIALAQVSGARLLYSNDRRLSRDFENRRLIHSPQGNVYTTVNDREGRFTVEHAQVLEMENLCVDRCIPSVTSR